MDQSEKKDVKPIFVIEAPREVSLAKIEEFFEKVQQKLEDYHVLVIPTPNLDFDFKAFYPEKYEEKDIQEIKDYIKGIINEKIDC